MSEKLLAGIDIGGTIIKYGLVQNNGQVRIKRQVPTPQDAGPESLFDTIVTCGEQLLLAADEEEAEVDYLGVGSPGTVDIITGVVMGACPNIPGWVGMHLRDRLAQKLNLPVYVDNDANCAAIAEHQFGAGVESSHIICLTIGTGIGGGLIINDEIYRGSGFSAGEVGHIKIFDPDDPEKGTLNLEQVVSSRAILANLKEKLKSGMSPVFEGLTGGNLDNLGIRKVFSAVKKGETQAVAAVTKPAIILGRVLAGMVNTLNPEMVILGGGVAEGGKLFVEIVKKTIFAEALPSVIEDLAVVPARMGNSAGFIGAAMLRGIYEEAKDN